jgi:hypothetical protein
MTVHPKHPQCQVEAMGTCISYVGFLAPLPLCTAAGCHNAMDGAVVCFAVLVWVQVEWILLLWSAVLIVHQIQIRLRQMRHSSSCVFT